MSNGSECAFRTSLMDALFSPNAVGSRVVRPDGNEKRGNREGIGIR
jgi:hypothetical protein